MHLFDEIAAFFTSHVVPFLKNLAKTVVKAEIDALKPIAEQAVADAAHTIIAAATTGNTASLGAAIGAIVADTAAKAQAAAITAGASSILASVGTALANNPDTATNLAPVTPAAESAAQAST